MKHFISPNMAISMPFAVVFASLVFFINETNFHKTEIATAHIEEARQTLSGLTQVMQHMIDAETGQRGYLITGDAKYLEPYEIATGDMKRTLDNMRPLLSPYPDELRDLGEIVSNVAGKLAEMDLTVRMRKEDKEDAWKFVLTTDVGKVHMDAIRDKVDKLRASSANKVISAKAQINDSLLLSRITIALLSMVGLLSFYMYLRQTNVLLATGGREQASLQRERDQVDSLVKERTVNLAQLATHLQNVREDERGDLARALHDEFGALLTAAKLDVARLKVRLAVNLPDAAERFEHLTATLNSVIVMTRRIVEDLRPSSLSHLGLTTSLEILAREFEEHNNIVVTTDLEHVDLGGTTQLTVYRLVQESLTNIAKYAQAKQVVLSLRQFDGYITVEVKDDGIGFKLSGIGPNSHGLLGMRHRVEAAGGRLNITSPLGRGTLISAVLPLIA